MNVNLEISMDNILAKLKSRNGFDLLKSIIDLYLTEKEIHRFLELLNIQFGNEIGSGIFHYIISDSSLDSIPDKNLRESLAKLNSIKSLYGPIINDSVKKLLNPFHLEGIGYSGDIDNLTNNLTVARNDGVKITVQVDMNASILLAKQTIEIIKNKYQHGGNKVNVSIFQELLTEIGEFIKLISADVDESKIDDINSEKINQQEDI